MWASVPPLYGLDCWIVEVHVNYREIFINYNEIAREKSSHLMNLFFKQFESPGCFCCGPFIPQWNDRPTPPLNSSIALCLSIERWWLEGNIITSHYLPIRGQLFITLRYSHQPVNSRRHSWSSTKFVGTISVVSFKYSPLDYFYLVGSRIFCSSIFGSTHEKTSRKCFRCILRWWWWPVIIKIYLFCKTGNSINIPSCNSSVMSCQDESAVIYYLNPF